MASSDTRPQYLGIEVHTGQQYPGQTVSRCVDPHPLQQYLDIEVGEARPFTHRSDSVDGVAYAVQPYLDIEVSDIAPTPGFRSKCRAGPDLDDPHTLRR